MSSGGRGGKEEGQRLPLDHIEGGRANELAELAELAEGREGRSGERGRDGGVKDDGSNGFEETEKHALGRGGRSPG